jgi:hypothetical protein
MTAITNPIPFIPDKNGLPLDGGFMYFGVINQNPETSPKTVYWDESLTQPALQPIRTRNGSIYRFGKPSKIFVDNEYSLSIKDSNGELVIYEPIAERIGAAAISANDGAGGANWATVQGAIDAITGPIGSGLIGHQPASGGTNRPTVKTELDDFLNAARFVKGDNLADDTAGFNLCLFAAKLTNKAICIPGGMVMRITSTMLTFGGLRIVGMGGAVQASPKFLAVGNIPIFTCGPGFTSESMCFENIAFDSATPGTASAFEGDSTSYLSQSTFKNVTFFNNLRYGINCPLIASSFSVCDFGTYPGSPQNFTAIRSVGTVGSFEPNANNFYGCFFRRSTALNMVEIQSFGVQWKFRDCVFEQLNCTQVAVENGGSGIIEFTGGYIENNTTPTFLRVGGSLLSGFCQLAVFRGIHLNSPCASNIMARSLAYPLFEVVGCYGYLGSANITSNEFGERNKATDLAMSYGNSFVAGTGSFGEISTVTGDGYNVGKWKTKYIYADQVNAVQKLGVVVSGVTTIATLFNPILGANFGGQICITAMSGPTLTLGTAKETASYVLNVSNGDITSVAVISATGRTTGVAANHPSFTFTIGGGAALLASPVGVTSGVFSFIISTVGLVKAV